jgi:hypothetical protein
MVLFFLFWVASTAFFSFVQLRIDVLEMEIFCNTRTGWEGFTSDFYFYLFFIMVFILSVLFGGAKWYWCERKSAAKWRANFRDEAKVEAKEGQISIEMQSNFFFSWETFCMMRNQRALWNGNRNNRNPSCLDVIAVMTRQTYWGISPIANLNLRQE